ncbi:alpha/beta fold hydrolase [Halovulum sp. GXIMD14793]
MTHPPAAHRTGKPDPLTFHLGSAILAYQQAILAAPMAGDSAFPWHDSLRPTAPMSPDPMAVAERALTRLRGMLAGISIWQQHPYRRDLTEPPVIWQAGTTRLLDYAPDAAGPTVLVVPSLINRAYVLDLTAERSMLRSMAAAGLRPVLVDWGDPGMDEARFDLDAYVTARLLPAAAFLTGQTGRPPAILGYCMGGALAVALATRVPVSALVTIGAPWSFGNTTGLAAEMRGVLRQTGIAKLRAQLHALVQAFGVVPDLMLQHLFALIRPVDAAVKFRKLAQLPPDSAEAQTFVALEDWLADGMALAGLAAEDLLIDWQLGDGLASGGWQVLARPVLARDVTCPALVLAGQRDIIAPPASAEPLATAIPGATLSQPDMGHVGMIMGQRAPNLVWRDVFDFLRQFG